MNPADNLATPRGRRCKAAAEALFSPPVPPQNLTCSAGASQSRCLSTVAGPHSCQAALNPAWWCTRVTPLIIVPTIMSSHGMRPHQAGFLRGEGSTARGDGTACGLQCTLLACA